MAVAEARKMEKDDGPKSVAPGFLQDALTFLPRKWGELRSFLSEVKSELKKATWPSWQEVRSTTVVVVATTFFFGFYLWGLDLGFSQILSRLLKR